MARCCGLGVSAIMEEFYSVIQFPIHNDDRDAAPTRRSGFYRPAEFRVFVPVD